MSKLDQSVAQYFGLIAPRLIVRPNRSGFSVRRKDRNRARFSKLELTMGSVQIEEKSYEMPPREGISVAHFLTVKDIARSARYYQCVSGRRLLAPGDGKPPPY